MMMSWDQRQTPVACRPMTYYYRSSSIGPLHLAADWHVPILAFVPWAGKTYCKCRFFFLGHLMGQASGRREEDARRKRRTSRRPRAVLFSEIPSLHLLSRVLSPRCRSSWPEGKAELQK